MFAVGADVALHVPSLLFGQQDAVAVIPDLAFVAAHHESARVTLIKAAPQAHPFPARGSPLAFWRWVWWRRPVSHGGGSRIVQRLVNADVLPVSCRVCEVRIRLEQRSERGPFAVN